MNVARILATKGTNVITVRPEQSIRQVITLLAKHNIGVLVAVDEADNPIGIISERDVIHAAAKNEQVFSQTVSELMSKDVIIGLPQDDLRAVAYTMTEKGFRHLPIVDRGKLAGIISLGDIVKVQRDQYEGEIDTLQTQMLAED